MDDLIARLAHCYGIADSHIDWQGQRQRVSIQSQAALLEAMGVDIHDAAAVRQAIREWEVARSTRFLPPVLVVTHGSAVIVPINLPCDMNSAVLSWAAQLESGEEQSGTASVETLPVVDDRVIDNRAFARVGLPLPELPLGYHDVSVATDNGLTGRLRVIVAPATCYEPAPLTNGARYWGISVQLYSLRSSQNWGIGDLRDLLELVRSMAPLGCNLIGLNPLHALWSADPSRISPYSPCSRHAINVLYISIEATQDFAESPAVRAFVASDDFQMRLSQLRENPKVDYARVSDLKHDILRSLYENFRRVHLIRDTARAETFRNFVSERGEQLRRAAIFEALSTHFTTKGAQYLDPSIWPKEYADARSSAVQEFASRHAEEVEYFCYLQWLANEQLETAQRTAIDLGMEIGLYGDLAVGADLQSCEVWENHDLYCENAAVGAPPDWLVPRGQDWGLPPMHPIELREQQYQPFVELLRANMRGLGALRLDHVSMLHRLWWLRRGQSSALGAYVQYPLEDLIGIVALESQRNRCLVIGEDLGTVADAITNAMGRYGIYHYRVMLLERTLGGDFKPPSEYPRRAVAMVTTHDLPTFRGWYEAHDIDLRNELGLYESRLASRTAAAERVRDRCALLRTLGTAGAENGFSWIAMPPYSLSLSCDVHDFLSCSSAAITLLQIEDLIGMREPANVPGTDQQYANWQRKVVLPTTDILDTDSVRQTVARVNEGRSGT